MKTCEESPKNMLKEANAEELRLFERTYALFKIKFNAMIEFC